jgi:pimeloyl-ACP methyl ester carboxylesterase
LHYDARCPFPDVSLAQQKKQEYRMTEMEAASTPAPECLEHWVDHGQIRLHVREKFLGGPDGKPVVILAHGSASAGRESFDVQVTGKPSYSLMDELARRGFNVFAPDIRGFGRSTRPEGHVTTREATTDLHAVVEYVCGLRGVAKVHLLGWSWGTQYAGLFVMAHPDRVARYVAYAQMHANSPDLAIRRERLDLFQRTPYIRIPEAAWKMRFSSMTPDAVNDPQVMDAFAKAAAAAEPKTPTGPQVDMLTLMPMLDASRIDVPFMMMHGEHDDVADLDGLLPFFRELPHPDKRYVVVPEGGHMLHLQKGHRGFQRAVAEFFGA